MPLRISLRGRPEDPAARCIVPGEAIIDSSRKEEEMESDGFGTLDEPMAPGEQLNGGSDDTRTLRFHRCDVCGLPVFFREGEEPQLICATCDVEVTTAIVDLLMKGHRIPQSWREADA